MARSSSTYATWWIRQACQRAVSNQSTVIRVPVHVHERRVKISRERGKLEAKLGRDPTREELAEATQLPLQHVEEALDAAQASVSLNQTVGGDNDGELGDLFADQTSADPSDEAADSYRRHLVRKAVGRLPEREARIVSLRFGLDGEPQSLEAIGKEVGLTRERVRQLETQAFARLQEPARRHRRRTRRRGVESVRNRKARQPRGAGPFGFQESDARPSGCAASACSWSRVTTAE